ncbi:DUF4287 domain-containing protein [Parafrigoribacterium soli]|uniref:DUF4287 domain-containing protein n=1 Tax=Parafrigoribacterium soli TaxID=3144663 RepID=UPI0032EF6159
MTFQAYLDSIKAKTGLGPEDFIALARQKGILVEGMKATPVLAWLKEDYDLGSGHAMAIFGILKEALQPRGSNDERVAALFAGGKAMWQEPYDELLARIREFGPDVSVGATDTYLSLLRGAKKFAVVYTTAARMDVGIKLKGDAPVPELVEGRLTPAGSWNSMVTHRVRITDASQLDAELLAWLRDAYDRAA